MRVLFCYFSVLRDFNFVICDFFGGTLGNQKRLHICDIGVFLRCHFNENTDLSALSLNTDVKLFSRGKLKIEIFS